MKQRVKQGCLAKLANSIPEVQVRGTTSPDKHGWYGKICTMKNGDIVLVMHIQGDGDCFVLTKRGVGWVMNVALESLQ